GINPAVRVGLQHHPGLALATLARRQQLSMAVVGMDLDAQRVTGVEELEQEGKWPPWVGAGTEEPVRCLVAQLVEGHALAWAVGHPAGVVFPISQHPGFADGASIVRRVAQHLRQAPAAPERALVNGLETQRVKRGS